MANKNLYDQNFFADLQPGARASAREVIPIVLQLVNCKSVVDVGCGTGEWLSVFQEMGVSEVLGLDGDYVDRAMLQIPPQNFQAVDLRKPVEIGRKFDLAISLEVAEHLPESSSKIFVESLTRLAPVVLFSASIPHQDGIHHINEQWNDYWVERFNERGYGVIDVLRAKIWQNEQVEWWYKQNILIFVEKARLADFPGLAEVYSENVRPLRLVHPEIFLHHVTKNRDREGLLDRKMVKIGLSVDRFLRSVLQLLRKKNG